jgi:hypothetical protein
MYNNGSGSGCGTVIYSGTGISIGRPSPSSEYTPFKHSKVLGDSTVGGCTGFGSLKKFSILSFILEYLVNEIFYVR